MTRYTDEQIIEIAKIVDGGYRGVKTTTVKYYSRDTKCVISTNVCDSVSIVTVGFDDKGFVNSVTRIGDDYSGAVQYGTSLKIYDYLQSLEQSLPSSVPAIDWDYHKNRIISLIKSGSPENSVAESVIMGIQESLNNKK